MNSVQANILKNVVNPAVQSINHSVLGFVTVVYQDERKVDVTYTDKHAQVRTAKKILFPKYGDGVFTQSLEEGDMVELSYRNQKKENMYISSVMKKEQSYTDLLFETGKKLPVSTNLF